VGQAGNSAALRLTAKTANVAGAPDDVRIEILRWSTDPERESLLSAWNLTPDPSAGRGAGKGAGKGGGKAAGKQGGKGGGNKGGGKGGNAPEPETPESSLAQALEEAPTVGYLWSSESTGYALRFAGKSTQPDGSQRVILITQRRLGAASPLWNPTVAGPSNTYEFSVVELRLNANGQGEGKASLTGQVVPDASAKIVSVGNYDALPVVFRDVRTRVVQP
jgi:hypothetical protein